MSVYYSGIIYNEKIQNIFLGNCKGAKISYLAIPFSFFRRKAGEKLGNLVVFCDVNKLQFDGYTTDICPTEPLDKKLEAFNWRVRRINGNDMAALVDEIDALPAPDSDVPTVIVCDTVKGKGVSFMENQILWHAGMLGDADYEQAIAEVEAAFERGE